MDFGHADDLSGVSLALPPDAPITAQTLERSGPGPARLRFGMPVWARKEWVGPIYPEDSPGGNYLPAYGRVFDTVEVNSTFYALPSPELIHGWATSVPAAFRFAVKVGRNLSHDPAPPRAADVARFLEVAQAFGDRLGVCFLQLPPEADLGWRRTLARLLDALAPHVPLVVELRHPAWFDPRQTRLLEHLAERDIGLVLTDTAGRRDLVHMALTAPRTFIRFRGQALDPTDLERIDAWVHRLDDWTRRGLRDVYFVAHQPDDHELECLPLLVRLAAGLAGRAHLELAPPPKPPERPQLALW
jgi:uncharacterized protein YecE (DUF72 family)